MQLFFKIVVQYQKRSGKINLISVKVNLISGESLEKVREKSGKSQGKVRERSGKII